MDSITAVRKEYINMCDISIFPIQPRRRLGDKQIDSWIERDKEIIDYQWDIVQEELSKNDDFDETFSACMNWDCFHGEDEMEEDI